MIVDWKIGDRVRIGTRHTEREYVGRTGLVVRRGSSGKPLLVVRLDPEPRDDGWEVHVLTCTHNVTRVLEKEYQPTKILARIR